MIKIENSPVFDMPGCNVMDYTIVKVYITERKDVMKYHSNAITAWQTSAMTVTVLLKIHVRK